MPVDATKMAAANSAGSLITFSFWCRPNAKVNVIDNESVPTKRNPAARDEAGFRGAQCTQCSSNAINNNPKLRAYNARGAFMVSTCLYVRETTLERSTGQCLLIDITGMGDNPDVGG